MSRNENHPGSFVEIAAGESGPLQFCCCSISIRGVDLGSMDAGPKGRRPSRKMRLRVEVNGDVARALRWEADRTGIPAERLARGLMERSTSRILASWRSAHRGVHIFSGKPGKQAILSFESVLRKAYGPSASRAGRASLK
jgi:hypothetical protein